MQGQLIPQEELDFDTFEVSNDEVVVRQWITILEPLQPSLPMTLCQDLSPDQTWACQILGTLRNHRLIRLTNDQIQQASRLYSDILYLANLDSFAAYDDPPLPQQIT